mgnify:CR=1 FL=1
MALVVVWLAASAAFFALRWAPGDALDATMARAGASEDQIAAQRAALGLDRPLPVQYARYWLDVVRGRWGVSLVSGQPVTELIAQNARPTLTLALAALVIALALGVTLGVVDGLERPAALHWAAGGLAALALAAPVYWTATLAIYALTVAIAAWVRVSRFGQGLIAIREDEDTARMLAVPTERYKIAALVLSAFLVGLFGAAHGFGLGYITTDSAFRIDFSLNMIVHALLGGMGTILGPLLGAAVMVVLTQVLLGEMLNYHLLVTGALLVAMVLLAPQGFLGLMRAWRR